MEIQLLGPLRIHDGVREHHLRREKARIVLALLLAQAGEPVPMDQLAEQLWGDTPQPSYRANIHSYVFGIRTLLRDGAFESRLVRGDAGYLLLVRDDLDVTRHRLLSEQGRAALHGGQIRRGERLLAKAVRLWRGQPVADLPRTPGLRIWAEHLQERHRAVLRDWTDARLRLGQGDELVGDLRRELAADPLCERLYAQLMIALYRGGRVAQALAVFAKARELVVAELGLDPGPSLTSVHHAILRRDPSLNASGGDSYAPGPGAAGPVSG